MSEGEPPVDASTQEGPAMRYQIEGSPVIMARKVGEFIEHCKKNINVVIGCDCLFLCRYGLARIIKTSNIRK
jgi:hypothetical protein